MIYVKELYSNTTKGVTARSVNLKDMEDWLTDAGKTARDEYTNSTKIKNMAETKHIKIIIHMHRMHIIQKRR